MSVLADKLTLYGHSQDSVDQIIPLIKEHGVVLVRGFLPRDLVMQIDREGVEAQARGLDVGHIPNEFNGPANALSDETLTALFEHCVSTGLVRSLPDYIGDDEIIVLLEQGPFGIRDRRPQRDERGPLLGVGWHQDITPNFAPLARRMVAMWCPLTPNAGLRSPGLAVITQAFEQEWWKGELDRGYFEPRMQNLVDRFQDHIWMPICEPGDVLFFNHLTFHGGYTLPEHDQIRRSFDFRFEGASNAPLARLKPHTRVISSRSGHIESVKDWMANSPTVETTLRLGYERRIAQAKRVMALVEAGQTVALWGINPLVCSMLLENPVLGEAVAGGKVLLVDRNTNARDGFPYPVESPETLSGFSGAVCVCAIDSGSAASIRKAAMSLAGPGAEVIGLQLQYFKGV